MTVVSTVAVRSEERMALKTTVDEVPKWIDRLVELVDGSHLEMFDVKFVTCKRKEDIGRYQKREKKREEKWKTLDLIYMLLFICIICIIRYTSRQPC